MVSSDKKKKKKKFVSSWEKTDFFFSLQPEQQVITRTNFKSVLIDQGRLHISNLASENQPMHNHDFPVTMFSQLKITQYLNTFSFEILPIPEFHSS